MKKYYSLIKTRNLYYYTWDLEICKLSIGCEKIKKKTHVTSNKLRTIGNNFQIITNQQKLFYYLCLIPLKTIHIVEIYPTYDQAHMEQLYPFYSTTLGQPRRYF